MMFRPATPLTLIFLVAFVLELLSTLSTPIIKAIPLGSYKGTDFGVFGWCQGSTCSKIAIGYSTDALISGNNSKDFSLPPATRHSLSSILVVHPVSAFLTLVCFGLAASTHFHSPSSSPRFLLGLLILTIPTLLITLLAFLVDILLFVPHMQWGGWIMLGATILIIASSVMTCAMRRTLVSRKARKKRIAENAEMSGENYYQNLAQSRMMTDDQLPKADSPPPMSGSTAVDKGAPQFASFEMKRQEMNSQSRDGDAGATDDRIPLNPNRDPSFRSERSGGGRYANGEMPPRPMDGRPSLDSQGRPRRPSRDQYGYPIPPGDMRSRGRGRGGYGPPPRAYAPQRGGYGPPRGGFRGGPPPPGWNGRGRGGYGAPGMRGPPPPRPPPPGYGNDAYWAGGAAVAAGAVGGMAAMGSVSPVEQSPRDVYGAAPHAPIGQAIEMDERTGTAGSLSSNATPGEEGPNYGLRDSDADVNGMVGLQQGVGPTRMDSGPKSPTSIYSGHYVPPRQQWQDRQYTTSPLGKGTAPSVDTSSTAMQGTRHVRTNSDYHEDVDPRFAVVEPSDDGYNRDGVLPNALTPGGHLNTADMTPGMVSATMPGHYPPTPSYGFPNRMQAQAPQNPDYLHPGIARGGTNGSNSSGDAPSLEHDNSADAFPDGGGSERSEASHFTSISDRPVNPNWRPGSQQGGSLVGGSSASAAQARRQDAILHSNPDFSIPGGRSGVPRVGSRGATPLGRYPTDGAL